MQQYKDVFDGTKAIDKRFHYCVDSLFLSNPGYISCVDDVFNFVTEEEYFSNKSSVKFPTIVNSTVSDDLRTIKVECEPRVNSRFWGANGSRMIRKGVINVSLDGIIRVSKIEATSLSLDEYENAKYFLPESIEEQEGPVVYICRRFSSIVNPKGYKFAQSFNADCYSCEFQDDEELRKIVNKSYIDPVEIIEPKYLGTDASMNQVAIK